jgi:hypothetical protein
MQIVLRVVYDLNRTIIGRGFASALRFYHLTCGKGDRYYIHESRYIQTQWP